MNRRDLIQMSDEEQSEFLRLGHTAILTSNSPDGYPHPVAMWYLVIDGLIHFATYAKSQKVKNLKRDPVVAVLIEDGLTYEELRGLLVQGVAEVVEDPELAFRIQRGLFEKYTLGVTEGAGDLAEGVEQALRRQASKRCTVVVRPEKVISWDHSKLGGVY